MPMTGAVKSIPLAAVTFEVTREDTFITLDEGSALKKLCIASLLTKGLLGKAIGIGVDVD